jgi:[glutamine synthetase] adenylyltransferase / [glutamine synthetase]-adenylyl-L-tyrosine phosphorylase
MRHRAPAVKPGRRQTTDLQSNFAMDLERALAWSRYARDALCAQPALRDELAATLDKPFEWAAANSSLDAIVAAGDGTALAAALRTLRRRVFLHTFARDLTGRAPLAEVVATITTLAETALRTAVALHARALAAAHGEPIGEDSGLPQRLIVVGMGKLGGGELNVSSDVDLVFVYPEEGETRGGRTLANREFFDRLGRRVIAALGDVTADGFVFRVDMRLRPYGDSGPLTVSFAALEHYLITQGRAWERYAWLKARPLTGEAHEALAQLVTPFVYRKYLDYDAYDELRDIHRQIRAQERRGDSAFDVKLGPGGIREVEFVAQALQIVRGGREPTLRVRGTVAALAALARRHVLPTAAARALGDAYAFLRNVEHRLQYRDDRQTQTLPQDPTEAAALAESLGFDGGAAFQRELNRHRRNVEAQFALVLGDAAEAGEPDDEDAAYVAVWHDPSPTPEVMARLGAAGYADPPALVDLLKRTRQATRYTQLPATSRQRFDQIVPKLLAVAARERQVAADPDTVFRRLFALLDAVSRRSAYLALVVEHPPLLPRLAHLMGASAWAAEYLTRHPILLDELLDARVLLAEPDWGLWREELEWQMDAHDDDVERQMDAMRHFQHAQTMRLLAQDLGGRLTVERLADHLSALADIVLDTTLARCWRQIAPEGTAPRFAIIGYGKLGGKELGYASDLDLVFLYDADPVSEDADAAQHTYLRLAQRINTWLTSIGTAGRLYDTDLRLRPDGATGLLVSSLAAFRKYQRESAWTWEHQALTRARFVAGDAAIGAAFEAEREAILRMPRDRERLAAEVVEMRRRMHAGHPNPTALFDLKHDPGGMVDIEFTVQFLVLLHSRTHHELTRNIGNIALMHMMSDLGLVPAALALDAAGAYRDYRREQHRIRLTGAPHARVDPTGLTPRRTAVDALWRHVFGAPWQTDSAATGPG